MNCAALILLRGGSKGLPGKNLKLLHDKPLYAWVVDEAQKSGLFPEIYISTESDKVKLSIARRYGSRIQILDRPDWLASDETSSDEVVKFHLSEIRAEIICLIQATSPLTRAGQFRQALKKMRDEECDSLLTATRQRMFIWRPDGTAVNYDPACRPRRQEFAGEMVENGAFYLTKRWVWEKYANRLGGKIALYEMDAEQAIEIDTHFDWKIIDAIVSDNEKNS